MKALLNAEQLKSWDYQTMKQLPISSIDLMEKAAYACVKWIAKRFDTNNTFTVLCGPGNNGGDGLAIARLLADENFPCRIFIAQFNNKTSVDFEINLKRLKHYPQIEIQYLQPDLITNIELNTNLVLIDALFGYGLNRPLDGHYLNLIKHINHSKCKIIAIDIPSGMPADMDVYHSRFECIKADYTLTFESPKQTFMLSEPGNNCGEVAVLSIGLIPDFANADNGIYYYITSADIALDKRRVFTHKGTYGHALCIGGSYGKMGAIALCAKACLQTGCGLVTAAIPSHGNDILQSQIPEVMTKPDAEPYLISQFADASNYEAICVGPGMGTNDRTLNAFIKWLPSQTQPLVIDADGLNCLAEAMNKQKLATTLPANAILTPHPKEFDRLMGETLNPLQRIKKQRQYSIQHKVFVVLKGAHTSISTPEGKIFFNSSGNAYMATAGSGDVLAGIITSFLAQGFPPEKACITGVFLHGIAGQTASEEKHPIMASDIIQCMPRVIGEFTH
jgi:NAD(P)H-hydrate epimerase